MQFLKFGKYNMTLKTASLILFFSFLLLGINSVEAQKKYTVVLDAGHGGKDPGNLGNGYKESIIALKVVLAIGKELEKTDDIEVVYTRKKNVFVELHNRAKIANNSKAALFVSVHCDSYVNSKAHGAGTFVLGLSGNKQNLEIAKRENAVILLEDDYKSNYDYDPNSPESVISLSVLQEENLDESLNIAGIIQDNFSQVKRFDRSVKQNNFLVLRETVMPSVLIELGFLTNKAEGRFLNSKSGQRRMALSISKSIKKYIDYLKLNTVYDKKSTPTKKPTESKPAITTTVNRKLNIERAVKPKKEKLVTKKTIETVAKKVKVTPKKEPLSKEIPNSVVVEKKIEKKTEEVKVVSREKVANNKSVANNAEKEKPGKIEFKVQIAASKQYLTNENFNFKGLENVEVIVIDEYFKYFYGSSTDFKETKRALREARKAGHKGAFVVAFEDGEKISLRKALKKK